MADFQRQKFEALTLATWRALDPTGNNEGPTRPVTDAAQPGWTKPTGRRPHGAFHPLEDTP